MWLNQTTSYSIEHYIVKINIAFELKWDSSWPIEHYIVKINIAVELKWVASCSTEHYIVKINIAFELKWDSSWPIEHYIVKINKSYFKIIILLLRLLWNKISILALAFCFFWTLCKI